MNIQATLLAWDNGIPALDNIGRWNDYDVFAPAYTADDAVSPSSVILADAAGARFATPSEAGSCLAAVAQ